MRGRSALGTCVSSAGLWDLFWGRAWFVWWPFLQRAARQTGRSAQVRAGR